MRPTAVNPIANPLSIRLTNSEGIDWWTGEAGYSSRVVKRPAEIIKIPSSADSMRYSGQ